MARELPLKKLFTLLSNRIVAVIDRAKMTEHTFMLIVAVLIGVLAGFAAIGIRALIREISLVSFPGAGVLLENIINAPWHLKLLIPVIGGLIVGPIIYFLAPEAKGHGVPEVVQAILLKGGMIRPRIAFVKAFASAVTIGTGDYALVKSIKEIANLMGKWTIAEYAENDEIIAILKEIGVDYLQGYGIHMPTPLEEIILD